jgi:pSer/pThr/pTyr-binding forkhead associated (FHA) protein
MEQSAWRFATEIKFHRIFRDFPAGSRYNSLSTPPQVMPRVTITVPDKMPQPYRFQLDRRVVMIGRGSDNDIAVDCGSISVRHAEMVRVEGGYELRDLGSTNGIKLDGKRCEVISLRHGVSVKLGDVAFDFQLGEEEREVLRREKVLDDEPLMQEMAAAPAASDMAARDVAARDVAAKDVAARAVVAESAPAPKKRPVVATSDGGGGFMIFLMALLFVVVAFFAGLAIHHYKETGGWLCDAIQTKGKTLKANREGRGGVPAADSSTPAVAVPAQPVPPESAPPVPVPVPAQ